MTGWEAADDGVVVLFVVSTAYSDLRQQRLDPLRVLEPCQHHQHAGSLARRFVPPWVPGMGWPLGNHVP